MTPDFTLPAALLHLPEEWQQCIPAFFEHLYVTRSHSPKSVRLYRILLTQFFCLCNNHPERVAYADVSRYLDSPCTPAAGNGGRPADGTRNMRQCAISSLYKFAAFYFGRPIVNPTAGMTYVKRQRLGRKRAFTEDELHKFFQAIPDDREIGWRDYALFVTYWATGRRREEVCRLRYGDIEPWVFVEEGKTRAGYRFCYFAKGKGNEPQYQELPELAYQAIMSYLKRSERLLTIKAEDGLFVAIGHGRHGSAMFDDAITPIYGSTEAYGFRHYLIKAGLDKERGLSLHSLRHTAAQMHWQIKPDLLLVSKFLGHSNIATTQLYIEDLFGFSDPVSLLVEAKFGGLVRR